MSEKMEELVIEPQPTDKENAFGPQVEMNAQRAENERLRRAAQAEERRAKERADEARMRQAAWEEQQKANRRAEKRARLALNTVAAALTLIAAGGFCLNYTEGVPVWVSFAMAVGGIAAFAYVIGWICGHRCRR